MRNFLGITVALVAVISFDSVNANCGKTSAFRYEFESWIRRYIFAVIGRTSHDIQKIFAITLSELELDFEQKISLQQELRSWHTFEKKAATPKADLEEIVKEFQLKRAGFEMQRPILEALATKNIETALKELDDVTTVLSEEYANELLLDWKHFGTMHDFETLGQREDCKRINEIVEHLRSDDIKPRAVLLAALSLFEMFEMHKWMTFMSKQENSAEVGISII